MAELEALLFDVDGTLADTEKDGHRVAFNAAFAEAGLDWNWSVELYGKLLSVTGGKERIRLYMDQYIPEFRRPQGLDAFIAKLHRSKTDHYTRMLAEGLIPLRPGVRRLLAEARSNGLRLAIATTTTPANVSALLLHSLAPDGESWFEVIAAGDIVPAKKPAPDIYTWAMQRMNLAPEQCMVFEDSKNGVLAAHQAGIRSIVVTTNDYTRDQDFPGACLVLDQFGDPDQPCRVVEGELTLESMLDVRDLARLHNDCPGSDIGGSFMSKGSVHIADRMQRIRPFFVMDLLARARDLERQGRSIVHMEIGEPDFVTPDPIIQAGRRALEQGKTHYTPALGLPELRQAIAEHYRERFGLSLDPRRVIVTPGASGALQLVMSVLINPGEKVLLADPGYPCNRHFVELVNGVPVPVPVGPESNFQLTAEQTLAAWEDGVQAVMVATPSNPTGTLLDSGQLAELYRAVSPRGARLIVDEIYQGLVYGIDPHTALSLSDEVFIINSFSKYFGMTGWRLGWIVAPAAYVDAIDRLAQNIFLSAPTLSQHAALAAFEPETLAILERRREAFEERRDFLLPALRELGFEIAATPQGAFYLYADCRRFNLDSGDLADELLARAGVAVTPGMDFGRTQPQRYLRFAYTTSLEQLREGVQRIGKFLHTDTKERAE